MSSRSTHSQLKVRFKITVAQPFPPLLAGLSCELRRGSPKRRRREGGGAARAADWQASKGLRYGRPRVILKTRSYLVAGREVDRLRVAAVVRESEGENP